ncbi:MAG: hypothetical protein JO112_23215 [Planctomycetes bacterium]|nr:hypothetical protein [Planctomycetota bacterium]
MMDMSQFSIINESTEDTFASTENLPEAIRVAREVAMLGQAGEPISILDREGYAVRQLVLLPNGTVAEQVIARPVQS